MNSGGYLSAPLQSQLPMEWEKTLDIYPLVKSKIYRESIRRQF
jgi:hypothetical protein